MNNQHQEPTLDEIHEFNKKCQNLIPLVNLLKIKSPPNTLRGLERDQNLAIMGFSLDEIEEMTGFKQGDYPIHSNQQSSDQAKISFYGREIWEKIQALNARLDAEWRLEHDRMLKNGIATGLIEEDFHNEPRL
jgi:hypothetical protein